MSFYRNHTCTRAQNCSELALGLNSDWWLPQCGVGLEGICERKKSLWRRNGIWIAAGWLSWERTCLPRQEMQKTRVQFLDQEDPLEKKMATHSSILAWRIPQTEGPGGLQSTGSQRVGLD